MEFDSRDSAYSTFSKAIEYLRKYLRDTGIKEAEFPSLKLEKGSLYTDENWRKGLRSRIRMTISLLVNSTILRNFYE